MLDVKENGDHDPLVPVQTHGGASRLGRLPSGLAKLRPDRPTKTALLDSAQTLRDLKVPPGNRLEALRGDRAGQHSIRVNDQYRVCFVWRNGDAHGVEIVDYH